MRQVLDLHIHSPYSRACSPSINLESIYKACVQKGVDVIGTSDFTHPKWFRHIKQELKETSPGSGLFKLKTKKDDRVKFILSTEVSLIYKDEDRVRKIHLVVHAPSLEAVEILNKYLDKNYNIKSDGRPILGIKAPEFVKLLLQINPHFLVYPAHIWTPWFSVFGSKSGFNSLEKCFRDQTKNIFAFETGLSSDPEMNWRLSALCDLTLLSSSDAHSLINIAREATVIDIKGDVSYNKIYDVLKNRHKSKKGKILYTIEFYQQEGKYYFDGHFKCNFSCSPRESKKNKNICPVCGKLLTLGVLNRVEELADRRLGYRPKKSYGFKKLVELDKIIKEAWGIKSRKAKKVTLEYNRLTSLFKNELYILLDLNLNEMEGIVDKKIIEGIEKVRSGNIQITPGFDGEYGEINIFSKSKQ